MSEKYSINIRDIISRMKRVEGLKYDTEVGELLGTTKKTVNTWKERNSIPWDSLVGWASKRGVSLDWLILEKGPMWSDEIGVADPASFYRVKTDSDIVYKIAAHLHRAEDEFGVRLKGNQFEELVRFLHRDHIESGAEISYAKAAELVKLFQS